MSLKSKVKDGLNIALKKVDHEIVRSKDIVDFYLHEYKDYDHYKEVQVFYNKKKINNVWADEKTLKELADKLKEIFPNKKIKGVCHGSRNGFEQKIFRDYGDFDVIGTDISDTATDFENTVEWDFHDENPEWIGQFDFVYSNSLDQAWNPKGALKSWLNQLNDDGVLIIEHTDGHGPAGASEMDPFGVRPTVMPYVLADWFGHDISISFIKSKKENKNLDVWFFMVKKNKKTF